MQELWQLYTEDREPIPGKGADKESVYGQGLLHGASHVWIWRQTDKGPEVLLQQRAASKRTWPNMLDISAAGHIDLGETPEEAAIRETKEELGLDVTTRQLELVEVHRMNMAVDDFSTENEFRWVYLAELKEDSRFNLQYSEVSSTLWLPLQEFESGVLPNNGQYVPQGDDYFRAIIQALRQRTA